MTAQYTKGPWRVDGTHIRDTRPGIDCIATMQVSSKPNWVDDASRIVACVNACEGVSNKDLEVMARLGSLHPAISTLLAQRSELLAALKAMRSEDDGGYAAVQARAAIASVEGGGE